MGTILRAASAYLFLLLVLRVSGRHSLNQMTPFQFILLFLLGGITIQAVVADDRSLTNAFLGVITIGGMNVVITRLKMRFHRFGRLVDGTPVAVIENGDIYRDRLFILRITEQDVMAAARARGVTSIDRICYAFVERNGSITILPFEEK